MYSHHRHTGKPANNFFSKPVICQARDNGSPDIQPVLSDKKRRENDMYTSAAFLATFFRQTLTLREVSSQLFKEDHATSV